MAGILDQVGALPEEEPVFQSSGVAFEVKSEDGHPVLKMIGVFLIVICGLGFVNGLDFISPESGLVRPHEWINGLAKGAPAESADFSGTIVSDGEAVVGAKVVILSENSDGFDIYLTNETDEKGRFEIKKATPGLTSITIQRYNENGKHDEVTHRIILNPPSYFEKVGYTTINFDIPPTEEFDNLECSGNYANGSCMREIDYSSKEMKFPLIDESAAGMYVMVGWAMIGLSVIACGFAVLGIRKGSRGLIQTSSVLVFFTAGHYWSACIFSTIAFALTFTVPRKSLILDA